MVDKTKQVDPGKLTAYERWELPNIGGPKTKDRNLANTSSQKLKPLTADDIEKIRQQAYDSGYEEGRKAGFDKGNNEGLVVGKEEGIKQGLAQGLEAGQSQINNSVAKLDIMLSELVAPIEKQQNLIEEAMLNVSMAVARTVIHRELSLDSSSIQAAINAIIADLPKVDNGFSLIIHPDDELHIKPILEKYAAAISLKSDPLMTPGGCIFNSSSQLIDYTIEKRFQKTVQSMLAEALKNTSDDAAIEVPSSIGALSDYPAKTLSDHDDSAEPQNQTADDASSNVEEEVQHIDKADDGSQDVEQKNE